MLSRCSRLARQGGKALSAFQQSYRCLSTAAQLRGGGGETEMIEAHRPNHFLPPYGHMMPWPEAPGKVIAGPTDAFVQEDEAPKSVLDIYREIAGNSAPTTFGIGLLAYCINKEYLIYNEEAYFGILLAGVITVLVKKLGPPAQEYFDQVRAEELAEYENERDEIRISIADELEQLDKNAELLTTADELYAVFKSTREMEAEAVYRQNLLEVETKVKSHLDYQIDLQNLQQQIEQDYMAKWVHDAVVQSITPEQEQQTILKCIDDIEVLAAAHATA